MPKGVHHIFDNVRKYMYQSWFLKLLLYTVIPWLASLIFGFESLVVQHIIIHRFRMFAVPLTAEGSQLWHNSAIGPHPDCFQRRCWNIARFWFSKPCGWDISSSAMWHCVIWCLFPDVSRQPSGFLFDNRNVQEERCWHLAWHQGAEAFFRNWQSLSCPRWFSLLWTTVHFRIQGGRSLDPVMSGTNPGRTNPITNFTVRFGSVSSPLCVWKLERLCSQAQLYELRCFNDCTRQLHVSAYWPSSGCL